MESRCEFAGLLRGERSVRLNRASAYRPDRAALAAVPERSVSGFAAYRRARETKVSDQTDSRFRA